MASRVKKIKKESVGHNKNLLLLVGFSCNNNCVVCSVKSREQFYPDRSFSDIVAELEQKKKEGFNDVEFTGGEPTIRKDIVSLVAAAKKIGYRNIAFSTNGRLFSYSKFCQDIFAAGLNKVTFSLLGPDAKTHDAMTRTSGSFNNIVAGIKNAKQFPGVHINISSVICRFNYKNLKKFGQFVQSLGVLNWYLLDLIPDSNAKQFYGSLVVRLPELEIELNSLLSIAKGFKEFGFFDFPLCLFSPELTGLKNVCLVNAKMRSETSQQVGYNPKRIAKSDKGVYVDAYRTEVAICAQCRYYKECGGTWKEYLDKFGPAEIKVLAKKHKCLEKQK